MLVRGKRLLKVRRRECEVHSEMQMSMLSRKSADLLEGCAENLNNRMQQTIHTSAQDMNMSVLRLPGDQFTTEDEELMSVATIRNCRNGVRRPLEHLMLGNLLPLGSQRACPRLGSHYGIELIRLKLNDE